MKKAFVFSDLYTEQMLLYGVDFLLNLDCDEIVLTEENHPDSNIIWHDYPIKITVMKNVGQCVSESDFTVIFKNNGVSQRGTTRIIEISELENKPVYFIHTPDFRGISESSFTCDNLRRACSEYGCKTTVLLISVGALTLSYDVEIMLAKFFSDMNVSFEHSFLSYTESIFEQLQKQNALGCGVQQNKDVDPDDCEIALVSVDIGNSIDGIVNYAVDIRRLNPDYIIVSADGNFAEDSDEITDYVRCCLGKKVDIILISPFCIIGKEYMVNISNHKNLPKKSFYINDFGVKDFLRDSILRKLSYPEGIELLG